MIEVIIWAASVFILWNLTAILVVYSKNWSRDDKEDPIHYKWNRK